MLTIVHHPELRRLTTLKLGGEALALVQLGEPSDLKQLPDVLSRLGGEVRILGRGSNILAVDEPRPYVIVQSDFVHHPEILGQNDRGDASDLLVRVGAGVSLPAFLSWAAAYGLSGLEGLSGIPGSVGGAFAMNAGSYGCEFARHVVRAEVYLSGTGICTLDRDDFMPAYRGTHIRKESAWWLVLAVDVSLRKDDEVAIRTRMKDFLYRKKSTQPVAAASAGCVFRNPEGYSAGKLLDAAGFRGKRLGQMAFSSLHANFLVNEGNGSSRDALTLMSMARDAVERKFGIRLEHEVKLWL